MNTATHTPTPWTEGVYKFRETMSLPEDVRRIFMPGNAAAFISGSDAEANAAFIVRAVNAHYELVRELRDAREELGELVQCRQSSDLCNCNEHCRLRNIDAALAKAGAA